MFKKLILLSDSHIDLIQKDANEREISFTEMVRRILDRHYEHGAFISDSTRETVSF